MIRRNAVPRFSSVATAFTVVVFVLLVPTAAAAQESVTVTLPTSITFTASPSSNATGVPNPVSVQFSNAILLPLKVLRISAIADASGFSGPGASSIPASKVSWTVSNAVGGVASSGTLSSNTYTQVFQGSVLTLSGSFNMVFTLAPVTGVAAGTHTLQLRWKIESVLP